MDIVIVYHPKDILSLKHCVRGTKNIENVRNIYCVSKEHSGIIGTIFIDETIYPFSKKDIEGYVGPDRAGWYFQQLLKLYAYKYITGLSDTFLVLDSDAIFINPTKLIDIDGLPFYSYSRYLHRPYFEHLQKLLGLELQSEKSGVIHHMIFQKKYLMEIIEKVELIHSDVFWKSMMKCVSPNDYLQSGMSEYELYFNYMIKYHSDKIKIRHIPCKSIVEIDNFEFTDLEDLSRFKNECDILFAHTYLYKNLPKPPSIIRLVKSIFTT